MAEYLVTGGCGFIGSHLADALIRQGHKVRILDDLSTGKRENAPLESEVIIGDVCDQPLRHEPTVPVPAAPPYELVQLDAPQPCVPFLLPAPLALPHGPPPSLGAEVQRRIHDVPLASTSL